MTDDHSLSPSNDPLLAASSEHGSESRGPLDEEGSFFGRGAGSIRSAAASSTGRDLTSGAGLRLEAGTMLGGFQLIELLGVGGMGQVWEAEEKALSRRVALKIVRPDRMSERALELFAREARAGGRLTHPGIAQVHAFGESDGVHWISQELVEGGWTLRDFIDGMRHAEVLPDGYYRRVAEFVALMADALQAAHDAGVIHRDVKPQNVLIDPDDRPRLTDFGLARVEGEDLELSQSGQVLGTYHYMSPEQVKASRSKIDHRTDVWSLGVVLYELLALQRPFEGDTGHQISTRILHADPPDLRKLRSRVPLDLAIIASKALDKRAEARYQTAGKFAVDLRSHLAHRPISAKAPTAPQRAAKWVQRNPTVSAAAAVGAAALFVISVLLSQAIDRSEQLQQSNTDLESQRALVQAERDRLSDVVTFQEGVLESMDQSALGKALEAGLQRELRIALESEEYPASEIEQQLADLRSIGAPINFTNLGTKVIKEEVLDPARQRMEEGFGGDEETLARLSLSLSRSYAHLGFAGPSRKLASSALALREAILGPDDPRTLEAMDFLAVQVSALGQDAQTLELLERLYEARVRADGPNDLESIRVQMNIMTALRSLGQDLRAVDTGADALTRLRVATDFESSLPVRLACRYADMLFTTGDLQAAELLRDEVKEWIDAMESSEDGDYADMLDDYAALCLKSDQYDEAEPYLESALALSRRLRGDGDRGSITILTHLAHVLQHTGRSDEAEVLWREVFDLRGESASPYDAMALHGRLNYGVQLLNAGDQAKAITVFQEVAASTHEGRESELMRARAHALLGEAWSRVQLPDRAVPELELALESQALLDGEDAARVSSFRTTLASSYSLLERYEDAREQLLLAYQELAAMPETLPEEFADLKTRLGSVECAVGNYRAGIEYYREAIAFLRQKLDADAPGVLAVRLRLASAQLNIDEWEQGLAEFEAAYLALTRLDSVGIEGRQGYMLELGNALIEHGRFEEGLAYLVEEAETCASHFGRTHPETIASYRGLGDALAEEERIDEALAYWTKAIEGSKSHYGEGSEEMTDLLYEVGWQLVDHGRVSDALPLLELELELVTSTHGIGSESALISAQGLGDLFCALDNPERALELLEPAMEAARVTPGLDEELLGELESLVQDCRAALEEER